MRRISTNQRAVSRKAKGIRPRKQDQSGPADKEMVKKEMSREALREEISM